MTEFRDAYLPRHRIATIRQRWLPEDATIEGYASPLLATNYINSPAFFVAAEDEILRPEVEAMALQLAARDIDVEIHLWRGMVHAFPVLADAMPESRQSLVLAADFARRAVGEEEATEPLVDPTRTRRRSSANSSTTRRRTSTARKPRSSTSNSAGWAPTAGGAGSSKRAERKS